MDETGEPCIVHVGDEKYVQNFSRKNWKEDITWKIHAQIGRYFKIYLKKVGIGGVDWIFLGQYRF